jgi:hypothetical protein
MSPPQGAMRTCAFPPSVSHTPWISLSARATPHEAKIPRSASEARRIRLPCDVCTLRDIILQQGSERIDLLKIDIKGAELEALQGIEDRHWSMIRLLVMEVAPANKGSLTAIGNRLRAVGFSELIVQSFDGDEVDLVDPMPCTLYAIRAPR